MASEVLVAKDVAKVFGGLRAVDSMSIDVREGEIVGLIGPNGAGKTTFFNCLAGFHHPEEGHIRFLDHDITRKPPHQTARLGLARTFQLTRALSRMTVLENCMLAAPDQKGESLLTALLRAGPLGLRKEEATVEKRAIEVLEVFGLTRMKDAYAGSLSGGQRKLLEMARALMMNPRMMLLDEPMAGVNPTLSKSIREKILELRHDHKLTFLVIEHDMETIMAISDRVIVMAEGKLLAEGSPEEVRNNRAVIDAYLGG